MSEQTAQVLVVLGSGNDEKYLKGCIEILKEMGISFAIKVASAHRSPNRVITVLKEQPNAKVVIAFAGHAAHLAGVIAAHVTIPVLAVPLPTSDLEGLDSLLACVQMPGGVPVATMAIGKAGSTNSGCFATEILALENAELADRWRKYRENLAKKVEAASREVEAKWQS